MSDLFLILTPLLVLVVVLLLGFAGCSFEHGSVPTYPVPLTLQTFVATNLAALGGVTLRWLRPGGGTMWEQTTVTSFTSIPGNNIFEYKLPSAAPGMWQVQCQMVAQDDGHQDVGDSGICDFTLQDSGAWVYGFEARGAPLSDFQLVCTGLLQK